ncbi:MAG: hypothetical protein LBC74_02295 [Planctomycetaceae bacterium]|nr:hypothetical protein [Planctomycetaceae bacterium]
MKTPQPKHPHNRRFAQQKLDAKIRETRLDLVPYLAVVGAKEAESNTVALRSRKDGELGVIAVEAVMEKLLEEIRTRNCKSNTLQEITV